MPNFIHKLYQAKWVPNFIFEYVLIAYEKYESWKKAK